MMKEPPSLMARLVYIYPNNGSSASFDRLLGLAIYLLLLHQIQGITISSLKLGQGYVATHLF